MKKIFINTICFFMAFSIFAQTAENAPSEILLPEIDINIQDMKEIHVDTLEDSGEFLNIELDPLVKPEITQSIKVDLEKTLPAKLDAPDKKKPVDAQIKFGYGANNNMVADFSVFIRELNPNIAVTYSRRAKDNFWIDEPRRRNYYSTDKLTADVNYAKSFFSLDTNLGFYSNVNSLQNQSIYQNMGKKLLNLDVTPSLKFGAKSELSLALHNSFFFTDLNDGESEVINYKNGFDYFLESNIVFSQVLMNDNYLNFNLGYDLNYFDTTAGGVDDILKRRMFHALKMGVNYSGIFKDAFYLSGKLDFYGQWKGGMQDNDETWKNIDNIDNPFFWSLLPWANIGYNFKEYFNCFAEGGILLRKQSDREWFQENDFSLIPEDVTPGRHCYFKTGIKAMYGGYITGYTNLEFAYNWGGYEWALTDKNEMLYTLEKRDSFDLILRMGLTASYRQIVKFTAEWEHEFLDKLAFEAGDSLKARLDLGVSRAGLQFFFQFTGKFMRTDDQGNAMDNLYLLDAGVDWSYMERMGIGAEFSNIIYVNKHQLKRGYDEPGFEFIVYTKIGF